MEEHVPGPKPRKRGLTAFIIENAHAVNPLPLNELARMWGCTPGTIYQTVSRLRKQGRIPPSNRQFPAMDPEKVAKREAASGTTFLEKPPSEWDDADLAAIDSLPILTAEQRKKLLSAIGMRPSQGTSQVNALGKLNEIDQGAGAQVGPPPPLTETQTVERLSRLMRAVGRRVSDISMEAAFGTSGKSDSESGPVAESTGEGNVD